MTIELTASVGAMSAAAGIRTRQEPDILFLISIRGDSTKDIEFEQVRLNG
jgi:hypothetical protein